MFKQVRASVGFEMIDSQRNAHRRAGHNQLVSDKCERSNCFRLKKKSNETLLNSPAIIIFFSRRHAPFTLFVGHTIMDHIPWLLNQSKFWTNIIL